MRTPAVLAALLVAVAFVGCGSDEDQSNSKADYIAKADALCAASGVETKELGAKLTAELEAGDFEQAAATAEKGAKISKEAFDEVKALERPEDGADEADAVFKSAEGGFEGLDATIAAIKTGEVQKIRAAGAEASKSTAETDKLAAAYGFQQCGRNNEA